MASRKDQVRTLNAIDGIKARWNSEWGEFRVSLVGLSKEREEDVAYYTDDFEDALGTAQSMIVCHRLEPVT